jgi:hypothetical protein
MLTRREVTRLGQLIAASDALWRLPRYHCICYGENVFCGRSYYNDDALLVRDIAAYRRNGWAVMVWQQVWNREIEERAEVLIFQSEPIHPLRIQMVARHFAKHFYRPTLLGWQIVGNYGYEDVTL